MRTRASTRPSQPGTPDQNDLETERADHIESPNRVSLDSSLFSSSRSDRSHPYSTREQRATISYKDIDIVSPHSTTANSAGTSKDSYRYPTPSESPETVAALLQTSQEAITWPDQASTAEELYRHLTASTSAALTADSAFLSTSEPAHQSRYNPPRFPSSASSSTEMPIGSIYEATRLVSNSSVIDKGSPSTTSEEDDENEHHDLQELLGRHWQLDSYLDMSSATSSLTTSRSSALDYVFPAPRAQQVLFASRDLSRIDPRASRPPVLDPNQLLVKKTRESHEDSLRMRLPASYYDPRYSNNRRSAPCPSTPSRAPDRPVPYAPLPSATPRVYPLQLSRTNVSTRMFGHPAQPERRPAPTAGSPFHQLSQSSNSETHPLPGALPKRKNHSRRKPADHIPRPRNAFILFRQANSNNPEVTAACKGLHNSISKVVGAMWNSLSKEEMAIWYERAEEEKLRHASLYPDYKYQPKQSPKKNGGSILMEKGALALGLTKGAAMTDANRDVGLSNNGLKRMYEEDIAAGLEGGSESDHYKAKVQARPMGPAASTSSSTSSRGKSSPSPSNRARTSTGRNEQYHIGSSRERVQDRGTSGAQHGARSRATDRFHIGSHPSEFSNSNRATAFVHPRPSSHPRTPSHHSSPHLTPRSNSHEQSLVFNARGDIVVSTPRATRSPVSEGSSTNSSPMNVTPTKHTRLAGFGSAPARNSPTGSGGRPMWSPTRLSNHPSSLGLGGAPQHPAHRYGHGFQASMTDPSEVITAQFDTSLLSTTDRRISVGARWPIRHASRVPSQAERYAEQQESMEEEFSSEDQYATVPASLSSDRRRISRAFDFNAPSTAMALEEPLTSAGALPWSAVLAELDPTNSLSAPSVTSLSSSYEQQGNRIISPPSAFLQNSSQNHFFLPSGNDGLYKMEFERFPNQHGQQQRRTSSTPFHLGETSFFEAPDSALVGGIDWRALENSLEQGSKACGSGATAFGRS